MYSLNRVELIGRIGRNPEMRYVREGRVSSELRNSDWDDEQGVLRR